MTEVSVCRKDRAREPRGTCRVPSEPFLEPDKLCSLQSRPEGRLGHRVGRHILPSSLCTWGGGESRRGSGGGQAGTETPASP